MRGVADILIGIGFIWLSYFDMKKRTIPVWLLVILGIVMLLCRILLVRDSFWSMAGGACIGVLFLCVSRWTKEAIGYGDSLLILLLGIYLGAISAIELVFWAMVLSSLGFLVLTRRKEMAFVPFLCVAYWMEVFL